MKVSIVIPMYDKFFMTSQLLMDIYQNCPTVDEVLLMDNGGKEKETQDGIAFWKSPNYASFPLRVLRSEENIGFLRISNDGLKRAKGDVIALISNDVRIHKDLPKIIKEMFDTYGKKILFGGRLLDFDTGWNCLDGVIYPYIEGWALIATREAWEEFGYFDERYVPHDCEDLDLGATAAKLGYTLMQFPPFYGEVMTHIGSQTISYGDERTAVTLANKEKFRQKWSKNTDSL